MQGIAFVKISNPEEAKEYGIDQTPSLIYFENGIPSIYEGEFYCLIFAAETLPDIVRFCFNHSGDLKNEEKVLEWLIHQVDSDEIEDVTDEMLDMLIKRSKHLAVLFCTYHDPFNCFAPFYPPIISLQTTRTRNSAWIPWPN